MTTLTISQGSKEGAYLEPDGTFAATLVSCIEKGKGGDRTDGFPPFESKDPGRPDYYIREWAFAIEGAPADASLVWLASSALQPTPRSKAYGIISALFGGRQPPVGTELDIEKHLIGRMALLTVHRNADGFMEVDNISPLPTKGTPKPVANVAPAAVPETLRQRVGEPAPDESLPF